MFWKAVPMHSFTFKEYKICYGNIFLLPLRLFYNLEETYIKPNLTYELVPKIQKSISISSHICIRNIRCNQYGINNIKIESRKLTTVDINTRHLYTNLDIYKYQNKPEYKSDMYIIHITNTSRAFVQKLISRWWLTPVVHRSTTYKKGSHNCH